MKGINIRIGLWCVLILCLMRDYTGPLHAQEGREIELTAQEILARVDRFFEYPRGMMKGKLLHILPDGRSNVINFVVNRLENDYLCVFGSKDRGDEIKVLYNLGGEDIWVYDIHAIKLFHKASTDKYDPILATNFNYLDMSNADYQSNYNATIAGEALIKGQDSYKLKLEPIYPGGSFGLLMIYVVKKTYIPLRIDFYDNDKVRMKSLSVVKVGTRNDRDMPMRCEMLDIMKGTVSIMEITGFDESMTYAKDMFFPQRLGEK